MQKVILALLFLGTAQAACPNQCSGHGTCGSDDVCTCYQNWGMGDEASGDCSDRVCPYEIAFVDTPDASGKFHKYMECSGKGLCDRITGECDCFDGYTGKGCQRQSCPNDCSGHGTCEYIEDLTHGVVPGQYWGFTSKQGGLYKTAKTFENTILSVWDYHKSMACVCDPRYIDVDCSRRMCPKSNDVMDERMNTEDTPLQQTQRIVLFDAGNVHYANISTLEYTNLTGTGVTDASGNVLKGYDEDYTDNTGYDDVGVHKFIHGIYNTSQGDYAWYDEAGENFALTFTSTLNESFTTYPIYLHNDPSMLSHQIELALKSLPNRVITDVEVQTKMGYIHMLNYTVEGYDYFGKRSYDGAQYTGEIDVFDTLSSTMDWANWYEKNAKIGDTADPKIHYIEMNVTFSGVPKGPQNLLTIETKECQDGCTPKLNGIHLIPFGPGNGGFIVEAVKADFNNYECGRRGKCDYETGECECFEGYTGEACSTQTALV